MKNYYVIYVIKSDGSVVYYSKEDYGWWSSFLGNATFYSSKEECLKVIEHNDFTKDCVMCDGTKFPPRLIHSALDICNNKPNANGQLLIGKISIDSVFLMNIEGSIQHPKNVKYEY